MSRRSPGRRRHAENNQASISLSRDLFIRQANWFFLSILMLAVGFTAKALIRWDRDGRQAHIFNPSAFSLEPAVAAGFHVLQRDDQPLGDCGLIDLADAVAGDAAHIALFEIGDCLQIDSHMVKDYRKKSSASRAGRRSPTLVAA